ncbi:MAG: peptidoglycan-associated lipoprotein Pal [Nitrospirota bacterium]
MKRFVVIMVIAGAIAVAGCSQKKIAIAPEQTPRSQMQSQSSAAEKDKLAADSSRESITEKQLAKAQQAEVQPTVKEVDANLRDILFDFDQYDLREDAKPVLRELATLLSKDPKTKVIIEGHCDERGTNEYNLALGERRAHAAKTYLLSLGIPSSRIQISSYGEEKPVCSEHTEDCWAKNRRDHFVLAVPGK